MEQDVETIGARIKLAREAKGWTTEKLADVLGVTENIIIDYEEGKAEPDSPMANRLAHVLGDVSAYYLLFGRDFCLQYGYAF